MHGVLNFYLFSHLVILVLWGDARDEQHWRWRYSHRIHNRYLLLLYGYTLLMWNYLNLLLWMLLLHLWTLRLSDVLISELRIYYYVRSRRLNLILGIIHWRVRLLPCLPFLHWLDYQLSWFFNLYIHCYSLLVDLFGCMLSHSTTRLAGRIGQLSHCHTPIVRSV
jgi:hypothetical protein